MNRLPYLIGMSMMTQYKVKLISPSDQDIQYYYLKSRDQHLKEIKQSNYDVIIVGGGATGAGVALDCGLRGLKSVVLESQDFSSGASSKSTKLIHGGVRYLQQVFDIYEKKRFEKLHLVAESLKERSNFMKLCGYLTKDFPTLIPCTNIFQLGYYYIGSLVYHMIYLYYSEKDCYHFKAPRIVGKQEIDDNYKNAKCSYGVIYYDGQFNDSRMVQDVLLTASTKGQNIINYVQVNDLVKNDKGHIIGVKAFDKINNKELSIQGKVVVNATGCYADELRLKDNPQKQKRIIPVAGSHIILPSTYGSKQWGYLIPKTSDGRVMYILPWLGNCIIGTTEKQLKEVSNDPTVDQKELIWLIKEFSTEFQLDPAQVTRDVKSKWCGIRPLVMEEGATDTKQISRTHVIESTESGLVSIMGGKWTIFRLMGQETVDKVCEILKKRDADFNIPQSKYKGVKLIGDSVQDWNNETNKMVAQYGIPKEYAHYYLSTYGDRAYDLLKIITEKQENLKQLHPKFPHTVGEIIYQIRYEQACKPEDILLRRTRMAFLDQSSIFEVYESIVKVFAQELKLNEKETKQYIQDNFIRLRKLEF